MNEETILTEESKVEQRFTEKSDASKAFNGRKWGIIGVIAAVLTVFIVRVSICNTPASRLFRQLDLGQRCLEEQNYKQAIVEFDKAITIDLMSVDAYLGKAQAYEYLGNIDIAIQTLEEGYERTENGRIQETWLSTQLSLAHKYLEGQSYGQAVVEFNKAIEIDQRSVEAYIGVSDAYLGMGNRDAALQALELGYDATKAEKIKNRIDKLNEILMKFEKILEINNYNLSHLSAYYLTYEQLESAYQPLAGLLEEYLTICQNDEEAWEALARLYMHMGKMELCLNTRQHGYEITGYKYLKPEFFISTSVNATRIYDEYGRIVKDYWIEGTLNGSSQTDIYEYERGDEYAAYTWKAGNWTEKRVYKYDSLGRISEIYETILHDDVNDELYIEYEYEDNNCVLCKSTFLLSGDWQLDRITYDEYGREVSITIEDSWIRY